MNQPVSVVSKAFCPVNVRHSVALGKTAQQRRLFVLFAARLIQALSCFCARYMPAFVMHTAIVRFVKVCFLLFLVSDGVFLCAALYNQLLLLNRWFIFALLAVLLAIALTCLLFDEVITRCKSAFYKTQHIKHGGHDKHGRYAVKPAYTWSQVPASPWGHDVALSHLSVGSRHFPETPLPGRSGSFSGYMPDEANEGAVPPTPLIRVLETIDLSSTNIEHFLDIKTQASFFPGTPGNPSSSGTRRTFRSATDDNDAASFGL